MFQYLSEEVIGIITNVVHYRRWREEFAVFWITTQACEGLDESGERRGGVKTT